PLPLLVLPIRRAQPSTPFPYTTLFRSASPLASMRFCPTGGISPENAPSYLSLPNVFCIGGSWVAPDDLVAGARWDDISSLAAQRSEEHRLNSSHVKISYAVFCLKKKTQ